MTVASVLRTRPDLAQGTLPAMLALLAFGWMGFARIIRADVLSVKEREFVWAARALGASDRWIIRRHVVPNAMWPTFVAASLDVGTYVLAFAALSFFGLGVADGYADWGQMLAAARNRIPTLAADWHIVVFPGAALVLFALGWTLFGDGLRDALDPRMRGRRA
jgi:peptide/nickel transport system permease protein